MSDVNIVLQVGAPGFHLNLRVSGERVAVEECIGSKEQLAAVLAVVKDLKAAVSLEEQQPQ
jgi:hypothetical protein